MDFQEKYCKGCEHYNNGMGSLDPCLKCHELNKKVYKKDRFYNSFFTVEDVLEKASENEQLKSVFEALKHYPNDDVVMFIGHYMYGDSIRKLAGENKQPYMTVKRKLEKMKKEIQKLLEVLPDD